VGLDIGKNGHGYGTYRIEDLAPLSEPVTIHNDRPGFEHFAHHLDALLASYPTVKLAHEPTGIYYEAFGREILVRFAEPLKRRKLEYDLVNPQLVKEARTALQRGRIRKTDAIDTQAIARCVQHGDVMPARFPDGHALLFQQWAVRFRRNELEKRRLHNQIMLPMDRLWPGAFVHVKRFKRQHPDLEPPEPFVETLPLERKLVQAILTHCPNPYDVLAFTVEEMVAFLRD
jgi:transposase